MTTNREALRLHVEKAFAKKSQTLGNMRKDEVLRIMKHFVDVYQLDDTFPMPNDYPSYSQAYTLNMARTLMEASCFSQLDAVDQEIQSHASLRDKVMVLFEEAKPGEEEAILASLGLETWLPSLATKKEPKKLDKEWLAVPFVSDILAMLSGENVTLPLFALTLEDDDCVDLVLARTENANYLEHFPLFITLLCFVPMLSRMLPKTYAYLIGRDPHLVTKWQKLVMESYDERFRYGSPWNILHRMVQDCDLEENAHTVLLMVAENIDVEDGDWLWLSSWEKLLGGDEDEPYRQFFQATRVLFAHHKEAKRIIDRRLSALYLAKLQDKFSLLIG